MTKPDSAPIPLPADARLGRVRLRVRDLERSARFYGDVLGLEKRTAGTASLAFGAPDTDTALVLDQDPAIQPRPPGTAGLFHVALLLPDRASLAAALARLLVADHPLQGCVDHDVSEAIYLADPDGNGLELYADRPRSEWKRTDGSIFMTTRPLRVPGLLAGRGGADPDAMPAGTRVGHIHLQVTDLAAAESFYHETLGFDVVNRAFAGALFLSAGGYHHHIGLNTWGRPGPPPPGIAGLIDFELSIPDDAARSRLADRLSPHAAESDTGTPPRFLDPEGNALLLPP